MAGKRTKATTETVKTAKKSVKSTTVGESKIFDDVYHTIITRMPQFIIPVINDAFGKRYPLDVEFEQLKNEFYTMDGMVVSDSIFLIRGCLYHVECQSNPDRTMAIRMFEYGMQIGMERAKKKKDYLHVELPESAVLYLRHTKNTPDKLTVEVRSPKGDMLTYESKVIKVQEYTKDVIFRKKLLLYLPFYIMRYEKELENIDSDPKRLQELLAEYEEILKRLEIALEADESSEMYSDLLALIIRISDYMLRQQKKARKEMNKMGGQVLELYSEKVKRIAEKEGKRNGQIKLTEAVKDIRNGIKPAELKKKYDAETIKLAKSIA